MVGKLLGNYEVLERLGAGGMGQVYRARDVKLRREVALKVLLETSSDDGALLARFGREAKLLASLNHPNIATIFGFEQHDGMPFLVLELLDGESLSHRLERGPLELLEGLRAAIQIAEALQAAHEKNIVHRDIKPSNVMLCSAGRVKVLDFGIGKASAPADSGDLEPSALADTSLTGTGVLIGTVPYMSPEQIRGHQVDQRADIWAFGCVLYEMLVGRRAFDRETAGDTLAAIIEAEPNWAALPTSTPPPVLTLLKRSLHKDIEQRTRDVFHIRLELQDALAELAPAPSPARTRAADGPDRPTGASAVADPASMAPGPASATVAGSTAAAPLTTGSDSLAAGERRQATMVVSRLGGYEAMVEQLAPHEVEALTTSIGEAARAAVERYGGIVNRFAGDELVALFGIPTAYEDASLRAVRAAREMHAQVRALCEATEQRVGEAIRLRSAVHAGVLVARPPEAPGEAYRIAGSPVKVADRLASYAEPDEILLSPQCQRVVSPFFQTEAQEPILLRGIGGELVPYRVLEESGLETRLEAAESEGLSTYAGRDMELDTLRGCLARALAGEGQFVTVVGEAGVGKSRLLYEFSRECESTPDTELVILRGRCQSFGQGPAYEPFIEPLRKALGVAGGEDEDDGVAAAIERITGLDPALEPFVPLLLDLLAIRSDEHEIPKHLQGDDFLIAMREALCAVFTVKATGGPVVMLLEDWHWADEASQDVLRQIAGMVSASPMLLAATSRPEGPLDSGMPAHHVPIRLAPLEVSSSVQIMQSILGVDSLPAEFGELIHTRTGGNPFFVEEICRALHEAGVVTTDDRQAVITGSVRRLHLPDTVEAVILTRLDRLDHDSRELLRLAAVIGREFERRLLERTLPEGAPMLAPLESLKALGLIQQVSVLPEPRYRFRHALTQEVAYENLLQHQRRALHGTVGEAIEELYPQAGEEHGAVLANHFALAEEWDRAVRYGLAAAQRSERLSQFADALRLIESVREWVQRLPEGEPRLETAVEVLFKRERLCETLGERVRQQESVDELIRLLSDAEDAEAGGSPDLARAYLRDAELLTLRGRFDDADEAVDKALRISQQLGDLETERLVVRSRGFLRWHQERYGEAVELSERAMSLDLELGDRVAYGKDLGNVASILRSAGEHERALACAEESLEIGEEVDDPVMQVYALHFIANIYRDRKENGPALEHARHAAAIAERHQLYLHQAIQLTALGIMHWDERDAEGALRAFHQAEKLCRDINYVEQLSLTTYRIGELLLALDRRDEGLAYLVEAAGLYQQLGEGRKEAPVRAKLGLLYEEIDQLADAAVAWERARQLGQETAHPGGELAALEGLARAARRTDPSGALQHFARALELAESLNDNPKQGDLLNSMGILEWRQGAHAAAASRYERALEIFRELDDPVHQGLVLNSLGVTLKDLERHEEARACLEEALAINRATGQRILEGHTLAGLGDVTSAVGAPEEALQHYQASLALRRECGDVAGAGWMLLKLAGTCSQAASVDLAQEYLNEASGIATDSGDTELTEACHELRVALDRGN